MRATLEDQCSSWPTLVLNGLIASILVVLRIRDRPDYQLVLVTQR